MQLKRKLSIRRLLAMAASSVILTVVLLWMLHPQTATAFGTFLTIVETKYPGMVGSRIDNCALCHISTAPLVLNSFGQAFQSNGMDANALDTIANTDSDGDGWSNLEEIQALTFPGDISDNPLTVLPFRIFLPSLDK